VAEAVELRADAVPAHHDIVVVRELIVAYGGTTDLPRLQDRHCEIPWRESRGATVGLDAQLVCLTCLDQLACG
jgi:hypothetical protein